MPAHGPSPIPAAPPQQPSPRLTAVISDGLRGWEIPTFDSSGYNAQLTGQLPEGVRPQTAALKDKDNGKTHF